MYDITSPKGFVFIFLNGPLKIGFTYFRDITAKFSVVKKGAESLLQKLLMAF